MTEQRTSDEVVHLPNGGWKYSDAAYHRRWFARVMTMIKVDENGCWRWQGFKGRTGYGQTNYRGRNLNVHRVVYKLYHGVDLATEQYVLHRCDVRDCVNPEHLFIGSQRDNNADCAAKGRHYEGSRTHCERGHPFAGDNLVVRRQGGAKTGIRRVCKACEKLRAKGLHRVEC